MVEFFWGLLQGGKTTTGALISVLATVLGALTPQDLAALAPILGGAQTVGTAVMVIGLLDKARKAILASRAQQ